MLRGRLFTKTISILCCIFFIGVFLWLFLIGLNDLIRIITFFSSDMGATIHGEFLDQTLMFCRIILFPIALAFLITMIIYLVKCFKDPTMFSIYYKPTILGLFFILFYIISYLFILQFSLYYLEQDQELFDSFITTTILGLFLFIITILLTLLVLSKHINRFISYFLFLLVLAISSGILFYYKTMVNLEGDLNNLIIIAFVSYIFPVLATFPIILNKKRSYL